MSIGEKRKLLSRKIVEIRKQINHSIDDKEKEVLILFMMDFKNSLRVVSELAR